MDEKRYPLPTNYKTITTNLLTMKKLILILSVFIFSCQDNTENKITAKYYTAWDGKPMPKCICRYYYNENTFLNHSVEFQDSCNKYQIFDKLKTK